MPTLDVSLKMDTIYEDVIFPAAPRPPVLSSI